MVILHHSEGITFGKAFVSNNKGLLIWFGWCYWRSPCQEELRAMSKLSDGGTTGSPLHWHWRSCHGRDWAYGYNLDVIDHQVTGSGSSRPRAILHFFHMRCKRMPCVRQFANWPTVWKSNLWRTWEMTCVATFVRRMDISWWVISKPHPHTSPCRSEMRTAPCSNDYAWALIWHRLRTSEDWWQTFLLLSTTYGCLQLRCCHSIRGQTTLLRFGVYDKTDWFF